MQTFNWNLKLWLMVAIESKNQTLEVMTENNQNI